MLCWPVITMQACCIPAYKCRRGGALLYAKSTGVACHEAGTNLQNILTHTTMIGRIHLLAMRSTPLAQGCRL